LNKGYCYLSQYDEANYSSSIYCGVNGNRFRSIGVDVQQVRMYNRRIVFIVFIDVYTCFDSRKQELHHLELSRLSVVPNNVYFCFFRTFHRVLMSSARFAEEKDRDYEAEISKMEKEAMERLDAKTQELMSTISSTGATSK
jgi:hypothetical protein